MEKDNKIDSRTKDEKKEGEQVVETDVPKGRFQSKQQVQKPVENGQQADPGSNPFNPKTVKTSGSQLKQESVARVITGTGGSAPVEGIASPSKAGLRTLSYSGNEGTILGNVSGTPVVDKPSRSDTRPGQKLDAVAKQIDYIASEQAVQEVDGSKPLQDNPDEPQGFLGHPENISARIQKVAEAVPGALLFSRSLDENIRDEIANVEGLMVEEEGVDAKAHPTETLDLQTGDYKPFDSARGNFIPKAMHIGVNQNGTIHSIYFDVDDVCIKKSSDIVNRSSSAFIRSVNIDEINRQNMEKVAGVETEKNWCPLVRVVHQPTQTIGYLTDDELTTGSELFMAYRFFCKAHSYFFNKASKDGQLPYRSFKEMLKGNSVYVSQAKDFDGITVNFELRDYLNGAPSLMIALYDSIAKYSKRGDILVQPRSWKMHKQTADNNINPFRINPLLAKYVAARDVFSTIDRSYDPLLPTNISDSWRLRHVMDFRKLMNYTHTSIFLQKCAGKGLATAGSKFNDIYDHKADANSVVKGYNSGAQNGTVYDYLNDGKGGKDYGSSITLVAGDKTGFDTKDECIAEALKLIDSYDHDHANGSLTPIVVFVKHKDGAGANVDAVYAICRYPGVYYINTTTANVQAFGGYSTDTDLLQGDVSVALEIIRNNIETDTDNFAYQYQNRQNPYRVVVKNALMYGIKEWAENMGSKLANPATSSGSTTRIQNVDNQGILWYNIPIVHSTTNMSLWDMIVCAAVPFMQKIRTNSEFDVLNYQDANGKYPFDQLKTLEECNPLASENFTFRDILQPLGVGTMKPATAISWVMPEKFWRISHSYVNTRKGAKGAAKVLATETFVGPWYLSEYAVNNPTSSTGSEAAKMKQDGFLVNYPSTRSGARSAFADLLYGMSERDIRLCLDMITDIPGAKAVNGPSVVGAYKYGLSNSGIAVLEYTNATVALDIRAYLTTPREIGLGEVAPVGYNSPADNIYYANNRPVYTTLDDLLSLGSSYRVRTWKVHDGEYKDMFAASQLIITRGGNFAQDWTYRGDGVYAPSDNVSGLGYSHAIKKAKDIGVSLSFNDAMEVDGGQIKGEAGSSTFKPFAYSDNTQNTNLPTIITLQKPFWTRVQQLPYALSPFDMTPEVRDVSGDLEAVDMTADPFDFMYIFGFIGYKASDYREDVYNRLYEKMTLGWTYITDPFVEASPILK